LAGNKAESETVDVAILDSINRASDSFREYNEIGRENDPINANGTTDHGHGIAYLLSRFTGDVKIHFYQTIHSNGEFRDRDLLQTLGVIQHVIDEIDVINLSAGLDHAARPGKDCTSTNPNCKVCRVLEDILDEHTVFVAASGDQLQTDGLVCPAISSEVIATGGTVAKCTADSDAKIGNKPVGPDLDLRPPNAFWIDRADKKGAQGTYCTNRGCLPRAGCMENRQYEPWEYNHDPTDAAPDILGPVHFPIEDEVGALLAEGSSFSAPIVSSQIANALGTIRTMGVNPTRNQIKKQITQKTKGCFDGKPGMLCGIEFSKGLGEPFNLKFELENKNEVFFTSLGPDSGY
jgi:hypothetical protein